MTKRRIFFALVALLLLAIRGEARADAAFDRWLGEQWPAAQALGVSRATFDKAVAGLQPDLSLPDLAIPGRPEKAPQQPEFVQTPAQYLREASFQRLAARGKELAGQYRDTLARISREFGVPGDVVLAIWARETDYGSYKLPHDALQVLATQAYTGKRKDFFRNEFLHALKMLQDGVPRADLRSSWGGAMGLTQFLPSEFYKYAVDFDHDGRADIWHSVPDALASAAKQLASKGWVTGVHWAYEVKAPANADCSIGVPEVTATVGEWEKRGFVPIGARRPGAKDLSTRASLLQPEGAYGPAFLATKNYFVLKDYNYSDLYVLFVGHLSDAIGDAMEQERAAEGARGREHAAAPHRARPLPRQDRRQGWHADARRARRLPEEERAEGRLLADRRRARAHAAVKFTSAHSRESGNPAPTHNRTPAFAG
jgi:lytic murein transglycosylase